METQQYKPLNNVIINTLSQVGIQYDTVVYIPTFCLTKKGLKTIAPSVYHSTDSIKYNREQLLRSVNLKKAFFTIALVYNERLPIGYVHFTDCETCIYNYRKNLFRPDLFKYTDVTKSELKSLLNRIIDIKADTFFRINNIVHTFFYIKDNELFVIRYHLNDNHLAINEYKYDDFVNNVMTESEFSLLDWYHSDNFGL